MRTIEVSSLRWLTAVTGQKSGVLSKWRSKFAATQPAEIPLKIGGKLLLPATSTVNSAAQYQPPRRIGGDFSSSGMALTPSAADVVRINGQG
jgi:hypothetical protein